ncbi:MAG TPA: choice-of-anchor D domain-containing protein, partial [Vicinamibacterales bacterium]|nr:choice-of-anchor D domain-containing protein [Vicinamibacterales bacterium]
TLPTHKGPATFSFDANTTLGASLTPGQLGFDDPIGCGLTTMNWTGGCGTGPGSTMTCPFGTTPVTVSASNNGISYSSSTDLVINVSDFSIDVSPASATVRAGQTATFTVTITPQSGRFNSPVALACNVATLPPGTTCTFSPNTVTPGASSMRSTMVVATTAAASVLTVDRGNWRIPGGLQSPGGVGFAAAVLLAAAFALRRRRAGSYLAAAGGAAVAVCVCVEIASAMSPGIAIFPASMAFPSQLVNTTTPSSIISVTNVGPDPLNVTSITAAGDFAELNNCGTALASGATCSVAVTFTPTATGPRTGSVTFVDDAAGAPHIVNLTGTGVAAPTGGSATPSGGYVVTVVGTSNSLTHTASPSLTVQ